MAEQTQATPKPQPQRAMTAGAYGGGGYAAAIIISYVVELVWNETMPTEVVAAMSVIIAWAAGIIGGIVERWTA